MKQQSQCLNLIFKALILCSLLQIFSLLWTVFNPAPLLSENQDVNLSIATFTYCFLYVLLIVACYKKWRVSFVGSMILNFLPFWNFAELGFTPMNLENMHMQPKISMLLLIASLLVSIVGIVIAIKNYLTSKVQ